MTGFVVKGDIQGLTLTLLLTSLSGYLFSIITSHSAFSPEITFYMTKVTKMYLHLFPGVFFYLKGIYY